MALPLIAALGAGILGGTRYLLNREDERRAKNTRSGLQSFLASSSLPQQQQMGILNQMQTDQQNSQGGLGGFLDIGQNRRANSLLEYAQVANAGYGQQQAQLAQQGAAAAQKRAFDLSGKMQTSYNQRLQDFGTLQDTYRKGINALEANDPANVLASTFNFYNLVEPGGIVRDSESGQYRSVGGGTEQVVNALNKIIGEGLTNTTRRQLQNAMRVQYLGRKERADRQRQGFRDQRDQWARLGYQLADPEGQLGIDWQLGDQTFLPQQGAAAPPPDTSALPATLPPSVNRENEAAARAMGMTTIKPGGDAITT